MTLREDITLRKFSSQVESLARPNRFMVEINDTSNIDGLKFFVTKATIPQVDISGPEIHYFGTKMMLAGDPKFEPLLLGFLNGRLNGTEWKVREYFENWISDIVDYSYDNDNKHASGKLKYREGLTITVQQLGLGYDIIASYEFYHAVPLTISSIELDMSSENTTEAFDVTFQYTHFKRV